MTKRNTKPIQRETRTSRLYNQIEIKSKTRTSRLNNQIEIKSNQRREHRVSTHEIRIHAKIFFSDLSAKNYCQ